MKLLAEFIMRGRMEAMIAASSLAMMSLIISPLSILSSAAVALVTLRKGYYEGLIILISSSLAAIVLSTLIQLPYVFIILYLLVLWLPVWLIAIVLREGRHVSLALEMGVLIGILCVIGYYLFNENPAEMWRQTMPKMIPATAPVDDVKHMINMMAPYMTGIAAAGGVFSMLFGLFLGRWWQANLYNPGGFRDEFLALKLQKSLAIVSFIILSLASATTGRWSEVAFNIAILLFVLYIFAGIAVLHCLFSKMKIKQYAVPMFYITLFLIPHSLVPVALVGFSDTWLDIRKRTLN